MLQREKEKANMINVERMSIRSNGNRQDPNSCRAPMLGEGSVGRGSMGSISRERANDSIQP